jgi:hypothetical protein
MSASGRLGLLGSNTSWAEVEDWVMMGELGDTVNISMGIVEVMIAGMAKLLVPKEAISASAERKDRGRRSGRVDGEQKRKGKALAIGSNKTGDEEVQGRRSAVGASMEQRWVLHQMPINHVACQFEITNYTSERKHCLHTRGRRTGPRKIGTTTTYTKIVLLLAASNCFMLL